MAIFALLVIRIDRVVAGWQMSSDLLIRRLAGEILYRDVFSTEELQFLQVKPLLGSPLCLSSHQSLQLQRYLLVALQQ
jgi:hypothetical protein